MMAWFSSGADKGLHDLSSSTVGEGDAFPKHSPDHPPPPMSLILRAPTFAPSPPLVQAGWHSTAPGSSSGCAAEFSLSPLPAK